MAKKVYSTITPASKWLKAVFSFTSLLVCLHVMATQQINPTTGGGFESGSTLAANGWTVVNNVSGTANNWHVGTASGSGSNFAYISNTGGTTHNYDVTGTSIVHFYQSVTVPAGETNIQLSFLLKSIGELNIDRLTVYTGTGALTAGTLPGAGYTAVFTQNSASTWASYTPVYIQLPAGLAGTTFNLVFTWQNNASSGGQPPASVDNVSLTSATCTVNTFPWTEGFEFMPATGTGLLPACWKNELVSGSNMVAANTPVYNGVGSRSGSKYIYAPWSGTSWMITPGMQLTGGTTYYFYYYFCQTSPSTGHTITTAVGTTQSAAGMTTTLGTPMVNPINGTYKMALYSYTAPSSGVYYFGVRNAAPTSNPWYMNYDDFTLSTTNPCTNTVPWSENFETSSPGTNVIPSCWGSELVSGSNNWSGGQNSTGYNGRGIGAKSGTHYMYANTSSSAWLYTPAIQLTGNKTYYFSYYYTVTDAAYPDFTITTAVGSAQSAASMTTTLGTFTNQTNTNYKQVVYPYTPSTTGLYYFGIRSVSGNTYFFNIDDVAVQSDDCAPPIATGAVNVNSSTENINWTCAGCTGSYIVEYGLASNFTTAGNGATAGTNGTVINVPAGNFTTQLTGLAANTQYRYFIRQDCGSGNYSVNYSSQVFSTTYCSVGLFTTGCSSSDAIIRFSVSNLNHTNSGCSPSGYGDFTASQPVIDLVRTVNYSWLASINYASGHWLQMWIDYDDNNVFDASEALLAAPFAQPNGVADPATFGSNFTIPANARTGTHRFRVRIVYSTSVFDACSQHTYGEVQDYTCNITAPACVVPASSTPSNVNFTSAQASWTCSGCTGNFIVEYGPTATFTAPGTTATAGTNGNVINVSAGNLSTVISGLANGTQYTYYVRQDCGSGNYSLNSTAQTFTTLGAPVVNQQTGIVPPGTVNTGILRLDMPVSANAVTLSLSAIKIISGNTNDADVAVSGVKLWSGTATTLGSQVGTSQSFASGSVTFSGLNLSLSANTTYYFWITYTLTNTATLGNTLDAKINAGDITFIAGGSPVTQPATQQDPTGNKTINYCQDYLYTTGCNNQDALIRFEISNLAHTGSACSGNISGQANTGYGDFTASQPVINLVRSTPYTWLASINYTGNHWLQMWIDLNDDGIFQSSEALLAAPFAQPSGVQDPATFGSTFILSPTATLGTHRFRVRIVYSTSVFDACTQYTYGEVQDYTCNITAPECTVPNLSAPSNVNFTSAQANWACSGCTGSYILEYGPSATFTTPGTDANAGTNGTLINVASGNVSTVISGLLNNTSYSYYIRQDCGSGLYSLNSTVQTFTTLGTPILNQQTGIVPPSTSNTAILRLDIPVAANAVALVLNSIKFTSGNTSDADIASSGVKLWTGTSTGPSTQIGTSQTFASGAVTFSGLNLNLSSNTTYYLWLTYTLTANATLGNVLDAKINANDISFTAGGSPVTQPMAQQDPAGNKTIDYCQTGLYGSGCGGNAVIQNFSVSNLNHTNSGCSTNGYANYTASQPTINLVRNITYYWTVSINYPNGDYMQMWIDYDDNGIFDNTTEKLLPAPLLQPSGTAHPATFGSSFVIPANAPVGNHRFRARVVWANSAYDACTQYNEGEVHDYTCNIAALPMTYTTSTTTQNNSDVAPNTTNQVIVGLQVTTVGTLTPLTLSSINFNTNGTTNPASDISNARIYYTGTSSTFATTSQFGSTVSLPNGSYTASATQVLAEGTNYFWLAYDIPAGATLHNYAKGAITSFVLNGTPTTPTTTTTASRQIELYCVPVAYIDCNATSEGGIGRVRLNTIDNASSCSNTNTYTNYTISPSVTQTTVLTTGQNYTIIVDRGGSGSSAYTVKVWIDYNNDGNFTNAAPELIYNFTSSNAGGFSGSFNVPVGAAGGNTRMRVRIAKNVNDACDNPGCACPANYGETEDYTVFICTVPFITQQPASTTVCAGDTASFSVIATGTPTLNYQWKKNSNNIGGANAATYTIPVAVAADADNYTVQITNACGNITSTPVATLIVNPLPATVTDLADQVRCANGNVTFSISDPGVGYTAQWSTNGTTNNDGTSAGGAGAITKTKNVTVSTPITEHVRISNNTTGCKTPWVSATGTANADPTVYNVTGGTNCGSSTIGLSGSETGIDYQLILNGLNTGAPVAGTGNAISFGAQTVAGTYTVVATNTITTCTSNMNGNSIVNAYPTLFNVTGGACVPAVMGLSGSEAGIIYKLMRNTVTQVGGTVTGTGNPINFGSQSIAGIYSVVASNATTGCTADMTGVSTVAICTSTWLGTTNTDWFTQTNWDPAAVPNLCAANVIIPFNVPNYPVISGTSVNVGNVNIASGASITLQAQNLTVCGNWTGGSSATNAAVVGSGAVLLTGSAGTQTIAGNTVFEILQVNNGQGAVLSSNANVSISTGLHLQTGNLNVSAGTLRLLSANANTNSYIDDFTSGFAGSITGNIIADRYVPVVGRNQHFVSSPVNNPNLTQVGASGPDGFYVLPTNDCDEKNSGLHSPYGSVFVYNDGYRPEGYCMLGNWMVKSVGSMENGKGYSIYLIGNSTLSLTGEANTGAIEISGLNNSGYDSVQTLQGQWIESGWNLVGNPYPSAIDMTQSRIPTGFQNQVQLWKTTGPFAGSWQPEVITPAGHVVVAPFQAFMVRTTHASTGNHTYQFHQDERVRNTDVPFYRTNSENTLKLELDYNGTKDVTRIAFNPSGTFNFDDEYDANKYNGGGGRPTLYTTTNANTWYAINTIPSLKQVTTVPMGLRPEANGSMRITAQGIETFDPTTYIYLEDKLTGKWHNLKDGAYTFATTKTDAQSRFVVHFTPPASILTTDASCEQAGIISIEQPGSANWNYTLTDITNNTIASGNLNSNTPVTVNANAGSYTLILKDNIGYTVIKTILVGGSQPVIADFAASVTTTQVQDNITFSSNTTGGTTYTWDFGDGTSASGAVTNHVYQTEGVYIVSLRVTGGSGCVATTTRSITVTGRSITGVENLPTSKLNIWSHDNTVYVDFSKLGKVDAQVELYNVIGQLVSSEKFGRSSVYTKQLNNTEAAYIIVRVKNEDKVTTKKLFISNTK